MTALRICWDYPQEKLEIGFRFSLFGFPLRSAQVLTLWGENLNGFGIKRIEMSQEWKCSSTPVCCFLLSQQVRNMELFIRHIQMKPFLNLLLVN